MEKKAPIKIGEINLSGFRGFPKEIEFSLIKSNEPSNLVLYGGNAKGKSTLADSIEFFLSEKGTLERFKEQEGERSAGRKPLINDVAEQKGIPVFVRINLVKDGKEISIDNTRTLVDINTQVPNCEASDLLQKELGPYPVIRGWELRHFVEDWSAQDNYKEVSKWFGLESLSELLREFTSYRIKLEKNSRDTFAVEQIKNKIRSITENSLSQYGEKNFLNFINETLQILNAEFMFEKFSKNDPSYEKLKNAVKTEEQGLTKDRLTSIINTIESITGLEAYTDENGNDHKELLGSIDKFVSATNKREKAEEEYNEKKKEITDSYLSDALTKAKEALESENAENLDECFVCSTLFSESKAGSKEQAIVHMSMKIGKFSDLKSTKEKSEEALDVFGGDRSKFLNDLQSLISKIEDLEDKDALNALSKLKSEYAEKTHTPEKETLTWVKKLLNKLRNTYSEQLRSKDRISEEINFSKTLKLFEDLFYEFKKLAFEEKKHTELKKLSKDFSKFEKSLNSNAVDHTNTMIQELANEVDGVYREILGSQMLKFKLVLPGDKKRNDKIHLRVYFSDNRTNVIPQGYLSDSQLHTLALAYRLVAIKKFNKGAPFVVMDDVVTSYDREHKSKLVKALRKHFSDVQLIILTHDRGFYEYLISDFGLDKNVTQFKIIEDYEKDSGPKFVTYNHSDEEVEKNLKKDPPNVNMARKAVESWLRKICTETHALIPTPSPDKPENISKSDLTKGLMRVVKKMNNYDKSKNKILRQLQEGKIQNLGSHFNPDQTMDPSSGDALDEWEEFKKFRDLFVCSKCGHKRLEVSQSFQIPVCKKCATPLDLSPR